MRIERKTRHEEKRILIGMVTDKVVLGRVHSKWQGNLFKTRWANVVATWCVKYYGRYGKAPMGEIESIYQSWCDKQQDKEVVRLVGKFLDGLSSEYEGLSKESNSDYIIDLAGRYFNRVQLEQLKEQIDGDLAMGDVGKAHGRVSSYNQINLGVGEVIDVMKDKDAMREAFLAKREPLIKYTGALGRFFGGALERDGFIVFMGPEKRGKSFWILDVAYRAMLQRRKVAYFQVGDMSKNQIMRRVGSRVAQHPVKYTRVKYPTYIEKSDGDSGAYVEHEVRKYKKPLVWQKAYKSCLEIMRKKTRTKETLWRLSVHTNKSISVAGIRGVLKDWERSGWVPDVIAIDYADILSMDYYGMDDRNKINETWSDLRSLSQEYHCLVVTATQANAASYGTKTMGQQNFSEDKRKHAHVTGMVGLNQTSSEKEQGVMRLNWIELREDEFHSGKCVHVAGCLALANPAVKSTF